MPILRVLRCRGRRYTAHMRSDYRLEPCRSALNRVSGMPFKWSLNPYTGCAHRCTFCYVRAFEKRADRPSDDRYGAVVRVKINVVDVLRFELSRPAWPRRTRELEAQHVDDVDLDPDHGAVAIVRWPIGAFLERAHIAERAAVGAARVRVQRPLEGHARNTVQGRATRLEAIITAHVCSIAPTSATQNPKNRHVA